MQKTSIEWTDYSWNPITGCLNGCSYCYARKLANGRLKNLYLANTNYLGLVDKTSPCDDPFYPRFWPNRLDEPYKVNGHSKIFVCDMSDLFGIGIPTAGTLHVLGKIRSYSWHTFQLLTKQPQNLAKFSPFPPNCWVGVSVCDDRMLDVAVDKLEDIQAKVKFISFEPLLERLTLSLDYAFYYSGISWVIIGACTPYSPKTAPQKAWVDEIITASKRAGIPYFLKDNLKSVMRETLVQDFPTGVSTYERE